MTGLRAILAALRRRPDLAPYATSVEVALRAAHASGQAIDVRLSLGKGRSLTVRRAQGRLVCELHHAGTRAHAPTVETIASEGQVRTNADGSPRMIVVPVKLPSDVAAEVARRTGGRARGGTSALVRTLLLAWLEEQRAGDSLR